MSVAAIPKYLGQDFTSAAPGHRFNLYLPVWQADWERASDTAPMMPQVLNLSEGDRGLLQSLIDRQDALASPLERAGQLLRADAMAQAPFVTGLGHEHPLENGFAFLTPYGLPYLPGSGVKGVLRAAARELVCGEFGDTQGWQDTDIGVLFGNDSGSEGGHRRGALIFWDVLPALVKGQNLMLEIMNPHQSHYLQGSESPHDAGSPVPIFFLAVPPGAGFVFHVQCQQAFLTAGLRERWQPLIQAALRHAFSWLGFGAKTRVGYGAMAEDIQVTETRARERRQAQEEERRKIEQEARLQALKAMSPLEREIQIVIDAPPPDRPGYRKLIEALASGRWQDEARAKVALHTRRLMEAARRWKEKTEQKKAEKDRDHQDTLKVMGWLKDIKNG
jgi:CRISPR-associated protein Cmr6